MCFSFIYPAFFSIVTADWASRNFSSFPAQGRSSGCSGVLLGWLCPRPCPGFQSFCSPSCIWAFKPYCAVFWGRGLRVDGFTHFLRGGVAGAQEWTSPTLRACRKISEGICKNVLEVSRRFFLVDPADPGTTLDKNVG